MLGNMLTFFQSWCNCIMPIGTMGLLGYESRLRHWLYCAGVLSIPRSGEPQGSPGLQDEHLTSPTKILVGIFLLASCAPEKPVVGQFLALCIATFSNFPGSGHIMFHPFFWKMTYLLSYSEMISFWCISISDYFHGNNDIHIYSSPFLNISDIF